MEQKQLHLLQVVESERTSRWQYAQQCDELASEVKKLRTEVSVAAFRALLVVRTLPKEFVRVGTSAVLVILPCNCLKAPM